MTVFGLADKGIHIVGELPTGLPGISIPHIHLSDIGTLIPIALACFLLAYGESISVARSFAQKHGYDINPEQELTAIGTANVATALTNGFPVAGGMSQTAVNDLGGASSPAALVVTSCAIALTLLFFAKFFHNLPEPVLAAIVLMAATHLVRIDDLRKLRLASRPEFRIALLAFFGVLFFGLLDGLLLAAAGSLVMLIAHAARPSVNSSRTGAADRRIRQSRQISWCQRSARGDRDPQPGRVVVFQRRTYPPQYPRHGRQGAGWHQAVGDRLFNRAAHRHNGGHDIAGVGAVA